VTPKQGPPLALILGLAGGGVALLLLLVGGGLWYAFSGKQEVAVNSPTPAEVVAPVPTDPSEDKKPAEELVEDKQPVEPAPEPKKEEEEPRDLSDVLNLGK
jgi:outer membrane biosynthesis protein TonB